jgi:hypothetical protein
LLYKILYVENDGCFEQLHSIVVRRFVEFQVSRDGSPLRVLNFIQVGNQFVAVDCGRALGLHHSMALIIFSVNLLLSIQTPTTGQ